MSGRWAVVLVFGVVLLGALLASSCAAPVYQETWSPPPPTAPPPPRAVERVEPVDSGPGEELFRLARGENRRLRWDECLASMAYQRARRLVLDGRFDHRNPRNGKNEAWDLIASCGRYRCAGENLIRGEDTPRAMHRALMESRKHRENILNPDFNLLGIGCYRNVCVELFAGR